MQAKSSFYEAVGRFFWRFLRFMGEGSLRKTFLTVLVVTAHLVLAAWGSPAYTHDALNVALGLGVGANVMEWAAKRGQTKPEPAEKA